MKKLLSVIIAAMFAAVTVSAFAADEMKGDKGDKMGKMEKKKDGKKKGGKKKMEKKGEDKK